MDELTKLLERMPRLKRKSANVAVVVGFLFGGIGLALYFRSVPDFFALILVVLITLSLVASLGQFGWLAGAPIAALYGYLRVEESNRRAAGSNETSSRPQ